MSHASKTRHGAGAPDSANKANGKHFLSLSIERLDEALKERKLSVPRNALIEAVSKAFGFRSSNAAIEAAREHRPVAAEQLLGTVSHLAVLTTDDGRAAVADLRKLEASAGARDPYVLLPLNDGSLGSIDRTRLKLLANQAQGAGAVKLTVKEEDMVLPATLIRQAWLNDHAYEIDDGRTIFDAGPALLSLSLESFERLMLDQVLGHHDNDALAHNTPSSGVEDHGGPFEVEVYSADTRRLMDRLGLTEDSLEALTEEGFAAIKSKILDMLAAQLEVMQAHVQMPAVAASSTPIAPSQPMIFPVDLVLTAWVGGETRPIDGGRHTFDAAPALLQLSLDDFIELMTEQQIRFCSNDRLAEIVQPEPMLTHNGSYEVDVSEEATSALIEALGMTIEDVDALTEEHYERVKQKLARLIGTSDAHLAPPRAADQAAAEDLIRACRLLVGFPIINDDGVIGIQTTASAWSAFTKAAAAVPSGTSPLAYAAKTVADNGSPNDDEGEIDVYVSEGEYAELKGCFETANASASPLVASEEALTQALTGLKAQVSGPAPLVPPLDPRQTIAPRLTLHVATISHRHGTDCYVAGSDEELTAQIAAYVRDNLHETDGSLDAGADDQELMFGYFEQAERHQEFLETWTTAVDLAPANAEGVNHTAGPWSRNEEGFIVSESRDVTIADFDCSGMIDPDEREANKALAIAAPSMAAFLQKMVLESKNDSDPMIQEAKRLLMIAGVSKIGAPPKPKTVRVHVAEISGNRENEIFVALSAEALDRKVGERARDALRDNIERYGLGPDGDEINDEASDAAYEAIDKMTDKQAIDAYFEHENCDEHLDIAVHDVAE